MFTDTKAMIDTSCIIQLRMERYAPDIFESLNREIEMAAEQTTPVTVDRVVAELRTKASTGGAGPMPTIEQTSEWARVVLPAVNDVVSPYEFAEISKLTADLSSQHQRWNDSEVADPLLTAAAEVLRCAVISGESPRRGSVRPETDLRERRNPKRIRPILLLDQDLGHMLATRYPTS